MPQDIIADSTPILPFAPPPSEPPAPEKDVYERWSKPHRLFMTAIMGLGILAVALGTQSLFTALPVIARDLDTRQETINDCLAGYQVMLGLSPVFLSPVATYYGRPFAIAICFTCFLTAGSIGISLSQSVPAFAATLMLQGLGAIPAWSLGSAVVGDLYPPETRGRGVAVFYVIGSAGSALSPTITGLFMEHSSVGWRGMLYFLSTLSFFALVLQAVFVPDTAHFPSPYSTARKMGQANGDRRWLFPGWWSREAVNPWTCVRSLKNRRILMMALYSGVVQFSSFMLMVPLTVTLAPRFNITSATIVGLLYLPIGVGDFLGGYLAGYISDKTLIHYTAERSALVSNQPPPLSSGTSTPLREEWVSRPEDRLRTMWPSGVIFLPGVLIATGWLIQSAAGGLAPILVLFFLEGTAVLCVLITANTYALHVAGPTSGEALSATFCIRHLSIAISSAVCLPFINATSVGWANTFAALLATGAYGLVFATIKMGDREAERGLSRVAPEEEGSEKVGSDGTSRPIA